MAVSRSMLETTLAPAPLWPLIRLASASAYPSRSASMSCSDSSRSPCSSPKLHKSVTTLRVNSTLPVPINAILTMRALLHVAHQVNKGEYEMRTIWSISERTSSALESVWLTATTGSHADDAAALSTDLVQRCLWRPAVGDEHIDVRHPAHLRQGHSRNLGGVGEHYVHPSSLLQDGVYPRSDRIVVRTPSYGVHAVDPEERDVDVVTRQERLCSGTNGFLATTAHLPTCGENP